MNYFFSYGILTMVKKQKLWTLLTILQNKSSLVKRVLSLQIGLMLFSLAVTLMLRSNLGVDPWTVFNVGAAQKLKVSLGFFIQLSGIFFLVISRALLRQPLGVGSVCNMLFIGPWLEYFLNCVPIQEIKILRSLQLILAIILLGFATALYISADFGAGPRDGFVLGISQLGGISIRVTRMGLELFVLLLGYWLGGPVGIGTVIFAIIIGPTMQFFLKRLRGF
jgi:uncharacterized membrane protein YczE